jgi:hypothetical protein
MVGMGCGMECEIYERSGLFSVRVHVGPATRENGAGPETQRVWSRLLARLRIYQLRNPVQLRAGTERVHGRPDSPEC